MPWSYLPLWIAVSTPLLYLAFFVSGINFLMHRLWVSPSRSVLQQFDHYAVLVLLAVPILSVIVLHAVIYDSWRHLFYIYPLLILIAVHGLQCLLALLNRTLVFAVYLLIAINSVYLVYWMVYTHPHQNVYFNKMAHLLFTPIKHHFELDYWGLSYKQGLEYIISHDPRPVIVLVQNLPGKLNMLIQKSEDRKRISIVSENADADYFITNFRPMLEENPTRCSTKLKWMRCRSWRCIN